MRNWPSEHSCDVAVYVWIGERPPTLISNQNNKQLCWQKYHKCVNGIKEYWKCYSMCIYQQQQNSRSYLIQKGKKQTKVFDNLL